MVEAYIDDMVIKSNKAQDHNENVDEVFKIFQKFRMKLNPLKCAFRVSFGQFLGHVVSKRGVELRPTQIKTLSKRQKPRTVTDVQSLAGKVAALSRFISKLSDRCKPFFWSIKQSTTLEWGEEQSETFKELKKYLIIALILSAPEKEKDIFLYLVVSEVMVSAILLREEGGKQNSVFYTCKMLLDAETRYNAMEKMVLALVTAKKKLWHYFESHTIVVMTNFPFDKYSQSLYVGENH